MKNSSGCSSLTREHGSENYGCGVKKVAHRNIFHWTGKFSVMVIAHRGFSGDAPENTLAAFQKAIEVDSDMMEFDVHISRDGQVVVIHDDTLERTTNGHGQVADYTLKELKQLDAGFWFAKRFSGETIPTLEEALQLAKGRILVNIEIKDGSLGQYTITDLADRTLQEVRKAAMAEQVIFSSFYPPALERIQERDSRVWVALLYHRSWQSIPQVTGGKSFSILNLRNSFLTKGKIARIHQEGMRVNTYTVNAAAQMERFIRWGIDGIITNHPDRLIKILQKKFQ
jgi:glycerophosphoryl diester phosphodiesterase